MGNVDVIPARRPDAGADALDSEATTVVRNSLAVSGWVVVSRLSGVARVGVTAAVLGATYLGNTFQAMNLLPNLAFEFLAGSLFGSLLIPRLVRHVDLGDSRSTERFANAFLGLAAVAFAVLTAVAILAGPLVLHLFTLGVRDANAAAGQRRVGMVLLALLMPQMLLYGTAAIGAAVMNAHGRFALAAAAPIFENIGIVATLVVTATLFGTGREVGDVALTEVVLLGAGTTSAVGLHAAVMWWGARRVGVVLRPRAGWRDAEVRDLVRRAIPPLGYVWLNVLGYFSLLVVANRVRGGVVAFQLALNFFAFPVAACAEPIAVAVRPRLARLYRDGRLVAFRDQLVRSAALTAFLTVPAAAAFFVLAVPLARAVAVGSMATETAIKLVSTSIAALALGVVGEAVFKLGRDVSYSLDDVAGPFTAMVIRTIVSLAIIVPAYLYLDGRWLLAALGVSVSAGSVVGAGVLVRRVAAGLPSGTERLAPSVVQTVAGAAIMCGPAYFVGAHPLFDGFGTSLSAVFTAAVVGLAVFVAFQRVTGSIELAALTRAFRPRRSETGEEAWP